jgi:hypothetical protein
MMLSMEHMIQNFLLGNVLKYIWLEKNASTNASLSPDHTDTYNTNQLIGIPSALDYQQSRSFPKTTLVLLLIRSLCSTRSAMPINKYEPTPTADFKLSALS